MTDIERTSAYGRRVVEAGRSMGRLWKGLGKNTDGLPGGGGEQPGLGYSLRVEPMGPGWGTG